MNVIVNECANLYHSRRGEYMTSHMMIRLIGGESLSDIMQPREDSIALHFGRAAHVLILEGQIEFDKEYSVGGPINKKTGKSFGRKSKRFQVAAAGCLNETGKDLISETEFELLEKMRDAVYRDNAADQLLTDGRAELTARVNYLGVPCQIRVDWITETPRAILDLKTTQALGTFESGVEQYGYMIQQAFYQAAIWLITRQWYPVYLTAVTKDDEPKALTWQLDQQKLDERRQEIEKMLVRVREEFCEMSLQIKQKREDKECLLETSSTT